MYISCWIARHRERLMETLYLTADYDCLAPDGSEIRLLVKTHVEAVSIVRCRHEDYRHQLPTDMSRKSGIASREPVKFGGSVTKETI